MEFRRATLETCSTAGGAVVVIDVLRAFSTAAYAFAAGAGSIALVSTVEQALELKQRHSEDILIGEVDGLPVAGFDHGNSPAEIVGLDLRGRNVIQRTSAGTQGMVASVRAAPLLAAGFCCARATARKLAAIGPDTVTFVITGSFAPDHGDEDAACADYIQALLAGPRPDVQPFLERVRRSCAAARFLEPGHADLPLADLEYCLQADAFDFAMCAERSGEQLTLRAVR